jgi:hypothetical protein
MSTQTIVVIIVVVVVLALVAGGIRRGPRVTQIDRTVRRKKDSDDA